MHVRFKLPLLGLVLLSGTVSAQAAAHTHARLLLAVETARPGDQVLAGVHFQMDPRWHIYWKNSGQSGFPPTVEWHLPPGVTAGEIQWPASSKLFDPLETTYIYEKEVVLLVPLQIASNAAAGPLEIKADLGWLECDKECVKQSAEVEAKLQLSTETKPSADAVLLASWQKKLPKRDPGLAGSAFWEKPPKGELRPLILEWNSTAAGSPADFFPDASEQFEVQPVTRKLPANGKRARLGLQVKKLSGGWPKEISGLIIEGQGSSQSAYEIKAAVTEAGAATIASSGGPALAGGETSIVKMLLYAFLGGLILNVMPCVLPVIALKILGFVSDAQNEPRRVRKLGLVYTAGVLFSFLVLALLTVGLKAAGQAAGWGFQFTNPYFLIIITTLVTLIALNLFGVFEVTLSSTALTAANQLASRRGTAGAFFNGLLATVLAASCTAPFLSTAIGFASSLNNRGLLTAFWLTVGLGLAAPYLVLSFQPAWLRFLPKPGPWMERFKVAMGFPMIGAAVWLCSIAAVHYGERTWWLVTFLLFVALAAWVFGEFVQRGRKHRGLAALVAAILLVTGYTFALENELEWRKPVGAAEGRRVEPKGLAWKPWSPEAVAAGRAQSRPVVVDFTAIWCLTCNTVVKPAFENAKVQKKLRELNAVLLVADYSLPSTAISEELKRFKRDGVPMVLVYPRTPDAPPMMFDLPGSGTLLKALDQAAQPDSLAKTMNPERQ